ncbi:MAG: hypothetical protein IT378_12855 [Sandaracinaceae bacterium]|nr:hypothetical protein [Sandaracinaceae bacterium]
MPAESAGDLRLRLHDVDGAAGLQRLGREVEACAAADANALKARADEGTCAAAGNLPELQRLAAAVPVPAACSSLASYCPVYGDGFFR